MVAPANRVKARCLFGKVKQDVMQLMQQLHDLVNSFVDSSQDVLDGTVSLPNISTYMVSAGAHPIFFIAQLHISHNVWSFYIFQLFRDFMIVFYSFS